MRFGACTDDAAEMHCESRPEVFAPFAARIVRTAEEVTVAIVGEIDLATSAAVWTAMEQATLGPRLILDLGETPSSTRSGSDSLCGPITDSASELTQSWSDRSGHKRAAYSALLVSIEW